ncbi:MAG: nucleotidyltransferase domain-containing protein [Vicinamibacteria bacterium]
MTARHDYTSGAKAVAERLARSLAGDGALAVALVGSHASGDATPDSDIDLAVVGEGPHYRLEVHDGVLISLGWAPAEEQRRRLYDPAWLGTHVAGWREAVLLHDPEGVGTAIKDEAHAWTWEQVSDRVDEWVAESVTGFTEEVQKLVTSLARGQTTMAAVQRSVLALRLASTLALHRRILYGSENRLWDIVGQELGPAWRDAQAAALGVGGETLEDGSNAALQLFALAAREVMPLLDDRQRAVIEQGLERTEFVRQPRR